MNIFTILYVSLVVFILYLLFTIGFPFLMAILVALLIEPIILLISKPFNRRSKVISFLVCSLFLLVLIGSSYLLSIKGVTETISLSKSIVEYTKENYEAFNSFALDTLDAISPITEELNLELNDFVKTGIDSLQAVVVRLSETVISMAQGIPNLILDTLIFIISLYLISMTLPNIKRKIINLFDATSHHKIELVMDKLYRAVFGFIRAQIVLSFFIFIMSLSGLLIIGIDFPLATAGLITAVDVLPIFGTGSVMVPLAIFYIFSGNYFVAIGLLILYGILFAFRRIIEPKILGDAIGIGALSALASMYIAFKLVGVVGLFLGPAIIILINALISADILKIKIKV